MTDGPIGVFDSGIGGLAVLRHLDGYRTVYVADHGFGMYGEQSLEAVRERSERISGWLIEQGAASVVVACNSASAAALEHLRSTWPSVPFVGMEPAVKPAAALSGNGTIGVLATEATFQGELFASVVDRFAAENEVIARACPGLAAAIEDDDPSVDALIDEYVGDVVGRGADVVVLGCTHYSLIGDRIAARAGSAEVVDPSPAVARQAARISGDAGSGSTTFVTTGALEPFAEQLRRLGFDRPGVGSVVV